MAWGEEVIVSTLVAGVTGSGDGAESATCSGDAGGWPAAPSAGGGGVDVSAGVPVPITRS